MPNEFKAEAGALIGAARGRLNQAFAAREAELAEVEERAKLAAEAVDVTGIVLTKLDGTAKGGIVVAVQRELGVPVKLVGLGEGPDDLAPFEPATFVDAILG